MTAHDWLLCLTNIGEIIGIFGSIALNKEAIMTGLIIGVGSLFTDTLLQRKRGYKNKCISRTRTRTKRSSNVLTIF
jgi:TPP-dependent trihydroxycyclohexane-1,2-dione (THcHDO) dehydratase